jgi:hypothetical protein
MFILPPLSHRNKYRILTPTMLEPIALIIDKNDFSLSDLQNKATELAIKYQSLKNEQLKSFQESTSKLTKNAQIYLADFLFFIFVWIAIFKFLPNSSWVQANGNHFWPVLIILSLLVWFAWFRVSRAIASMTSLLLMYVSSMILTDPDMKTILEGASEKHNKIREKLEELLRKERQYADSRPSLLEFIRYKTNLRRKTNKIPEGEEKKKNRGWPFPTLYERGLRFSWDKESYTHFDNGWISGYIVYLYYRLYERLSSVARAVWQLVRYIVTGAP